MKFTRLLHVANGTATTRLIEAAGIPGRVSIWADPLYEGPVPGGLTDAELIDVRRAFLGPSPAPVNDLRRWRAVIEQHESYDELILWFEHDLFDQLNLLQLLSWIHDRVPAGKRVTLICIGSFPGRPRFKGLGELTPGEIALLLDTRRPVTDSQYALAGRAWRAFREPTPQPFDDIREENTAALPYLADAIVRFLEEYPWTRDGLSRTERRLLQLAERGPRTLLQMLPLMHEEERAYYVTDASLAGLAESLAQTPPPLLTLSPANPRRAIDLEMSVTLTETGRAVLAGEVDRIRACGIDRWFGGVHLEPGRRGWRWEDARRQIIESV